MPVILKEQRACEKFHIPYFLILIAPLLKYKCLEMDTRIQFLNPPYLPDFSPCDVFPVYECQSKITEPYLITFFLGIVDSKCGYFL